MRRSRIPKRAISKRAGPACAAGAPTWWNNAQGLNPCDLYQAILDKCGYVAPTLIGDEAYFPVAQAETCMCNTITYNIGSACQDCQRGTTDQGITFSSYSAGGDFCESTSINLPDLATPTDDIPLWAYLDTSTQFWTYTAAQEIALNSTTTIPTSSATSTPSPSTAAPMDPTPTITLSDPTSSPTATLTPSTAKSTNAGAIGGGVAGGVVLVLAVIGLLLFLRRRRARDSHGDSSAAMATGGPGRNGSVSSESSLTESGKVAGSTNHSHSHYTPHSQMTQLNHNGSGVHIPTHSTSALTTPIDAPPVPTLPHEYTPSTPARSLAASPTPSAPAVQKVKRVPVRYSEDELAQAEEEAKRAAQHQP